jgi:hypothetical protein
VSSSTPSSTSSLSAETVSVVIGASAPPSALSACLKALEHQRAGVEVLVCASAATPASVREQFSWARYLDCPGLLVPELWREGIDQAEGSIVALTIAPMVPAPDWIERIRAAHATHDAVGGAIDPGESLRLRDWAEYFCRYARETRPFPAGASDDLAGDNAAYKRALLERWPELYRDGFWEPEFHRRLLQEGITLWLTPDVVVYQGRSAGARAFLRQRLEHGRKYGNQRGATFTAARNAIGVAASPLVPFVLTLRIVRRVLAKGRFRGPLVASLPLIFAFNLVWAAAEAAGHAETLLRR